MVESCLPSAGGPRISGNKMGKGSHPRHCQRILRCLPISRFPIFNFFNSFPCLAESPTDRGAGDNYHVKIFWSGASSQSVRTRRARTVCAESWQRKNIAVSGHMSFALCPPLMKCHPTTLHSRLLLSPDGEVDSLLYFHLGEPRFEVFWRIPG